MPSEITYVPSRSAVVTLRGIVEALAMTAHEQDLVGGVELGIGVQGVNNLRESLPLSGVASSEAGISLVDETKVHGSLTFRQMVLSALLEPATYIVEARSNSVRLILQEVASDGTVADISRSLGGVEVVGLRCAREKRRGSSQHQLAREHYDLL